MSRASINRYLTGAGLIVPDRKKRPRSSFIRFAAGLPNECWQADFTHYRLTLLDGSPGAEVEILCWLDDCSRYAVSVTAHHRVTGSIVLTTFRDTIARHGIPACTLTDNGMVFTTRLAGGKGGRTVGVGRDRRARSGGGGRGRDVLDDVLGQVRASWPARGR